MRRAFGIINFFGILYLAFCLLRLSTTLNDNHYSLEELKLSYAVDLATDAATQDMLNTSNLGTDYVTKNIISVDPQLALDQFLDIFCMNYGMVPNKENKILVTSSYMPFAAVAGFDGYYLATNQLIRNGKAYPKNPIQDGDWGMQFSLKKPYKYVYDDTAYALNMGAEYNYNIKGDMLSKSYTQPLNKYGSPLSRADTIGIINNILSKDISYTLNKENIDNVRWKNTFYLPRGLTTFSEVNPVQGVSFITLIQNFNLKTPRPLNNFTIGGSKVDNVRYVVGYDRAGKKYYTYSDLLPSNTLISEVFNSAKEAATAGYNADVNYLE